MKCVLQAKSKTSIESWNFIPSFLIQLKKKFVVVILITERAIEEIKNKTCDWPYSSIYMDNG